MALSSLHMQDLTLGLYPLSSCWSLSDLTLNFRTVEENLMLALGVHSGFSQLWLSMGLTAWLSRIVGAEKGVGGINLN